MWGKTLLIAWWADTQREYQRAITEIIVLPPQVITWGLLADLVGKLTRAGH